MENEVRYSEYKPRTCRGCYWWLGKKKGCELGEENCYYSIHEDENKERSPCDGCCYANPMPCIGYCIKRIKQEVDHNGSVSC